MITVLLALHVVEYSQVAAAMVAVIAGVVAAIRYIIKKYTKNLNQKTNAHPAVVELKENQNILTSAADENSKKLNNIAESISEFKGGLDEHMKVEEKIRKEEYEVIKKIQKDLDEGLTKNKEDHKSLFLYLDALKDQQVEQALNVVKSLAISDRTPTLLYKTVPGDYSLIWHNKAWTEWTGLSIDDSRAGGDMLTVHPDDRVTIEPNVEETGQLKEEVDVQYMLVNPKTGESIGKIWAHGYPIHTSDPEAWYYVSRIKMLEPEPGYEHLG